MIIFVGPRRQTHLLRTMKRDERMPAWGTTTYSSLFRRRRLPAATYIFVAVDRLDLAERRLAGQLYRHINAVGPGFRALNDPARAMGRYRLLRTLFEAGLNDFNVYLAAERDRPSRYPVFVRRNALSTLPLTGLLETREALDVELDHLVTAGEPPEDLIIIEYCTEALRENLYQKLAIYRVGERFMPRATLYGSNWFVKNGNPAEAAASEHEADARLLEENPWGDAMKTAFDIAAIEYGRVDFSIVNGRPQVYEINFNPDLRTQRQNAPHPDPQRRKNLERTDDLGFEALQSLDRPATGSAPNLDNSELRQFRLRFWRNYAPQRY